LLLEKLDSFTSNFKKQDNLAAPAPLLRPAGAAFAASGAHRGTQSKKALS